VGGQKIRVCLVRRRRQAGRNHPAFRLYVLPAGCSDRDVAALAEEPKIRGTRRQGRKERAPLLDWSDVEGLLEARTSAEGATEAGAVGAEDIEQPTPPASGPETQPTAGPHWTETAGPPNEGIDDSDVPY
jgi:hypothetical protein